MKKKYSGRKRAGLVIILRRSSYQSTALKTLYNFTFEPTLIGWNARPQMDENIRRQSPLSPEFAVKRSTGSNWTQNFRCKFMQIDLTWKENFDSVKLAIHFNETNNVKWMNIPFTTVKTGNRTQSKGKHVPVNFQVKSSEKAKRVEKKNRKLSTHWPHVASKLMSNCWPGCDVLFVRFVTWIN